MKQRLRAGAAAVLLVPLLLPIGAVAEDTGADPDGADRNWYGRISTGYIFAGGDADFFGTTTSVYGGTPRIEMDEGGQFSLAFGTHLPGGWRLEGDFGYLNLNTDTDSYSGTGDRTDDRFLLDGEIEAFVFMLNVIHDFDVGNRRLKPFVKGGIGVAYNEATAELDIDYDSPLWIGTAFEGERLRDYAYPEGSTTEFAWNLSAGVRLALARQFSLTLEYGLIDLGEALTETDEFGDAIGFSDLLSEQLLIGIDYRFD